MALARRAGDLAVTLAAGALNRRVTIQRRADGYDEAGQPVTTWEDVATVWANIAGQTGMGAITRAQDGVGASIERYSIRIRYREGLDAGMRVVHGSQVFDVRQVRMDFDRREFTDLVCELGGNGD